jgi:LL-diaminopimelate aminotransferase
MVKINENYNKLPGSYLFSEVARRIAAYSEKHPSAKIHPPEHRGRHPALAPAVIQAMHRAVDEMGTLEGFRGYGPEQGYDFSGRPSPKTTMRPGRGHRAR